MVLYEPGDIEHVKYTIAHYRRKSIARMRNCDIDELDVHALSGELSDHFLVRRLASANTRRRRRLEYWSHHRLNLSRRAEAAKRRIEDENGEFVAAEQGHIPQTAHTAPTAATTATQLDVSKIDISDDRSIVSGTSFVEFEKCIEDQEDGIDIPELPSSLSDDENIKEFECPYCFTVCSKRFLRRSTWR